MVHSGQASGGHYYSYIKQRVDDGSGEVEKWYKFDDVDVSECNIDQVVYGINLIVYIGNISEIKVFCDLVDHNFSLIIKY